MNKEWFILHNPNNRSYSLVDKDHLRFYKDSVLIQELDEGLSDEEARKFYIDFLDLIYPPTNKK